MIELRAADLGWSVAAPVLADVSAAAARATVTAVIGPNAAGKSTLLRSMLGAIRPLRGRVLVDGRDVSALGGRALAERIAWVPQRGMVATGLSAEEIVGLGRFALPPDRGAVRAALSAVGLDDRRAQPFRELSMGQQQRVLLARALAQHRPGGVLLLDEPTAALDLRWAPRVLSLLAALARDGATVLVALHDLAQVAAVADTVWLVADGRLTARGPCDEVLTPSILEQAFGVPFAMVDIPSPRVAVDGRGDRADPFSAGGATADGPGLRVPIALMPVATGRSWPAPGASPGSASRTIVPP